MDAGVVVQLWQIQQQHWQKRHREERVCSMPNWEDELIDVESESYRVSSRLPKLAHRLGSI